MTSDSSISASSIPAASPIDECREQCSGGGVPDAGGTVGLFGVAGQDAHRPAGRPVAQLDGVFTAATSSVPSGENASSSTEPEAATWSCMVVIERH
jgi:hypothetical protein